MGNFNLTHVSYSSLYEYEDCPRKFYWHRVRGHKPKFNKLYFLFGSAIHEALAAFYNEKIRKQIPMGQRYGFSSDPIAVFDECIKNGYAGAEITKSDSLEKTLDIGRRLLKAFMESGEKIRLVPKGVERRFEIDLANPLTGEKLGVKFRGVMDLTTVDDIVVEHKTSGSEWKQERVDEEMQVNGYALAYRLIENKNPKAIVYNILVKQVTRPRFQCFVTYRDEGKMLLFFEWAKDLTGKIRYGLFPYNRGKKCRTCPYRNICI